FASGPLALNEKLGPILWQLPPVLPFDEERLARFFELLPRDTIEAAALARRHDHRVSRRSWLRADARRPLRHALEVRHESFRSPRRRAAAPGARRRAGEDLLAGYSPRSRKNPNKYCATRRIWISSAPSVMR